MVKKKKLWKEFSHSRHSPAAAKSEARMTGAEQVMGEGECCNMRLEKQAGTRSDRNLCIMLNIWNFTLHSVQSIEGCLGDLMCTFKILLWLLYVEWHGDLFRM